MNYSILTNIFEHSSLSSIMKLINAYKDINLLWFVGRERFIRKLFDTIETIDIIQNIGPDEITDFSSSTIYNNEEISYEDMINYLNIIISMNSLKSTSYYCCPFIDHDIEFDKVLEYYEYMIKYKIY